MLIYHSFYFLYVYDDELIITITYLSIFDRRTLFLIPILTSIFVEYPHLRRVLRRVRDLEKFAAYSRIILTQRRYLPTSSADSLDSDTTLLGGFLTLVAHCKYAI